MTKNPTSIRLLLAVLAGAISTLSTPAIAAGLETPDFRAKVKHVDDSGIIRFEGQGAYRLWGVIPKVAVLEELILGKTLICIKAGELSGGWGDVKAVVGSVLCIFNPDDRVFPEELAIYLLDTGNAQEFCAETRGLWGHCPNDLLK